MGDKKTDWNHEHQNHQIVVESKQYRINSINNSLGTLPNRVFQKIKKNRIRVDIDSFKWKKLRVERLERIHLIGHSMSYNQDKVYIFGGMRNGAYCNALYELNIETKEVKTIDCSHPNIPEQISWHKAVVFGQKILIFGGMSETDNLDDYFSFNPSRFFWTKKSDQKRFKEREHFSVIFMKSKNQIYIFGGYYLSKDGSNEINYNDIHCLNLELMQWTRPKIKSKTCPKGRFHHTANLMNGQMVIFGGANNNGFNKSIFGDFWKIRLNQNSKEAKWEQIDFDGQAPSKRFGHSSVKFADYLIIHGGFGPESRIHDDTYLIDWATRSSTHIQMSSFPRTLPRVYHSMIRVENSLYLFGGQSRNNWDMNQNQKEYLYKLKFSFEK